MDLKDCFIQTCRSFATYPSWELTYYLFPSQHTFESMILLFQRWDMDSFPWRVSHPGTLAETHIQPFGEDLRCERIQCSWLVCFLKYLKLLLVFGIPEKGDPETCMLSCFNMQLVFFLKISSFLKCSVVNIFFCPPKYIYRRFLFATLLDKFHGIVENIA